MSQTQYHNSLQGKNQMFSTLKFNVKTTWFLNLIISIGGVIKKPANCRLITNFETTYFDFGSLIAYQIM